MYPAEIKIYNLELDSDKKKINLKVKFIYGISFEAEYNIFKNLNIDKINYKKSLETLKEKPDLL